jgi:Na+-translocating ferredoxin:NAD+ oxidoreductase subunit G
MSKNNLFMPAIILCVICLLTIGILAVTFGATADARKMQAEIAANANRLAMFPDAVSFDPVTGIDLASYPGVTDAFLAKDAGGSVLGYLVTSQYRGYGGAVPVLTAFGTDAKVLRLKVLANDETPGLGKKVEAGAFLGQFKGLGVTQDLSVYPHDTGKYIIDAIAGVTISSRAVTNAVNAAIQLIRQLSTEVQP